LTKKFVNEKLKGAICFLIFHLFTQHFSECKVSVMICNLQRSPTSVVCGSNCQIRARVNESLSTSPCPTVPIVCINVHARLDRRLRNFDFIPSSGAVQHRTFIPSPRILQHHFFSDVLRKQFLRFEMLEETPIYVLFMKFLFDFLGNILELCGKLTETFVNFVEFLFILGQ